MPNQPKTPARSFRIPEHIHTELVRMAAERGISLSQMVVIALEKYLQDMVWEENN